MTRRPPMIFKPEEIPAARGEDVKPKRGRPKKPEITPIDPRQALSFSEIRRGDLETKKLGPRIPDVQIEYLKLLFQKTKHRTSGYAGIQQTIMALIEVVKNNPKLEKQVVDWLNQD